ncbi:MAG: hypothetical protein CL878_06965 [Dehalococcoidia bacterium]|nr:hypothetical protein [Dehalococcoidia bacterium]
MLTFVIVAVALLFPVLVLLDTWRRRRNEVPETGSEQEVDAPLTQGNARKLLFGVVLVVETFLLLIAYAVNEPGRQEAAAAQQHEFLVERGAHSYVSLCMSCHGLEGRGFLEGEAGVYIGRPLNTGKFQIEDTPDTSDDFKEAHEFIYKTVQNGRANTPMPAWGVENGGPLNYEMINEVVALIMSGEWEAVRHIAEEEHLATPTAQPVESEEELGKVLTVSICGACHAISGTDADATAAPSLDGAASRDIAGVLPFNRDNVVRWVQNPAAVKEGTQMPPYPLSEDRLRAIAAYLETLK